MPPLARPARALPVRRTIGGQSLPEAHRKRAEIGAAEDDLRRVRQIERTPGDERTTVDRGAGPVSTPATASGCERSWIGRGPRAIPWKLSTSNADATVTGRGAVSWLGPTKGTANANANAAMPARTSGSRTTGRDRVQDRFHRVSIS